MANILIVDDSRTSRKILKNLLEGDGHSIIGEATNGEEGIALYKEFHPDIVTMDITMPVLNGIEALKQILEFDSKAKVIMVTAAGQRNMIVDAIKIGAMEFLSKPFEPEEILEIVTRILES